MNDRIKELMLAASEIRYSGMGDTAILDEAKFAELLVDACAAAAEEYWNDASLQKAFTISEYIYNVVG